MTSSMQTCPNSPWLYHIFLRISIVNDHVPFLSFPCTMTLRVSRFQAIFPGAGLSTTVGARLRGDRSVPRHHHLWLLNTPKYAAPSAAIRPCHRCGIQPCKRTGPVSVMGAIPPESILWRSPSAAPVVDDRSHMVQHRELPVRAKCAYDSGQKAPCACIDSRLPKGPGTHATKMINWTVTLGPSTTLVKGASKRSWTHKTTSRSLPSSSRSQVEGTVVAGLLESRGNLSILVSADQSTSFPQRRLT